MKRQARRQASPLDRLRASAEQRAALRLGASPPQRSPSELTHELHVHQIELEMQNEELRRTQAALAAARDRYVDLYDRAPVGYATVDAQGIIVEVNLTGAAMLGAQRKQLQGQPFARYVASDDADRWHRFMSPRNPNPGRIELALPAADGRIVHVQVDGLRVALPGEKPVLRITLADICEHKRVESELRLAATAFDAQEGIMITDERGVIQRVNRAFTQITGYGPEEAIGRSARLLHSGRHDAAFYSAMWELLLRTGAWEGEVWNRRKNGEVFVEWLTIAAVHDHDREGTRYVGTMLDISQRKSREDEIAQLAFYDPLTNLPNRRLMKDRLHQAMALSARTDREGALMFVDLDHFKGINDTLGHDIGDLLLQQVAHRLTLCMREGDTVARPGGDEFIVMLAADLSETPVEAAAQAQVVGKKILAALNEPYQLQGTEYHGSASIGVALFSGHDVTVPELLKRADQAMYQAKAEGRNTLRFYNPAAEDLLLTRTALEAEMRIALQRSEFLLHYQPEVDRDRGLLGAEALIRWQHPQRGLVLPDDFISVAESSGLIHPIGLWVLETACTQLATWAHDPAMDKLTISVNVSARQLRDPRFVEQVAAVLARTGAPAKRLNFELTEGMLLDNVEDTIEKMLALRTHGVGFSLDDFGTGYASLSYLKRLPLEQLKIDRSFVRDVLTDAQDASIARTIVELGRTLGLTVVAEGVETEGQRDLLADCGCHVFQGYLFGRPAPADALREMARGSAAPH
ncbi:MAG: putative bifunctional diguanylate cyclase/phosphodiesterase [Rhizobacter sp.]